MSYIIFSVNGRISFSMIYLLASLVCYFSCLRGQLLDRKFVKHYVDITLSPVLGEVFTRSQLECSRFCGKNINCIGFMRLSNGNCVMFDDVSRNTPGLTQVFIEGKRVIINNTYNIDVTVVFFDYILYKLSFRFCQNVQIFDSVQQRILYFSKQFSMYHC